MGFSDSQSEWGDLHIFSPSLFCFLFSVLICPSFPRSPVAAVAVVVVGVATAVGTGLKCTAEPSCLIRGIVVLREWGISLLAFPPRPRSLLLCLA